MKTVKAKCQFEKENRQSHLIQFQLFTETETETSCRQVQSIWVVSSEGTF